MCSNLLPQTWDSLQGPQLSFLLFTDKIVCEVKDGSKLWIWHQQNWRLINFCTSWQFVSSLKPRSTYPLLKLFDFIPQKLSIQFVWADNPEDTNCISTWLSICKLCKACSNFQLLTNALYSTKAMEEYENTCNVIWYYKPLWHHKVMWLLDVTTSASLKQAKLGISRKKRTIDVLIYL